MSYDHYVREKQQLEVAEAKARQNAAINKADLHVHTAESI
jgi:hypothetical protein